MKYLYAGILLVISLMLAAGCANLGSSSQGSGALPGYSGESFVPASKDAGWAVAPTMVPTMAPGIARISGSSVTDQKLIKTGSLTLEVQKVPDALTAMKGIAEKYGGYLSSSSLSQGSADRLSATATLRVPAGQYDAMLAEVRTQGKVISESLNAQDVTEEYVDLTAQREARKRQLDQYNLILQKADKIEDILKIQVEIERVQVELDRLQGRLQYLDNRVDLATLSVYLQEPAPIGGNTGYDLVAVINDGIRGFMGMVGALIILFFTLLPLVFLGVLGYGIYRWRKQKSAVSAPLPPEPPKQ
ncbi:MAG: DUF4349 domain-containing protein [Methanomicrobiales archaeon]|nr:DUF4349 domain-containing protein [Methanomicrobiales archaeon]